MFLHILLTTAKLVFVVCDNAENGQNNHHRQPRINPQHLTYKYQARPAHNDPKTFQLIRQMMNNKQRRVGDQKHQLFAPERNTQYSRRPIILLNRNNEGSNPQRFPLVGKRPRKILNWPSKTLDEAHARNEILNNQVHLKQTARKVKLDNNLKFSRNNTKNVKSKGSLVSKKTIANLTKPVKEAIDRTFLNPPKIKSKSKIVPPTFIIKQAGPSQQFPWIGHGTYAPLDVPNIFKAAGLDTHWDPENDKIFETGLLYPIPPAKLVVDKVSHKTKYSSTPSPVVFKYQQSSKKTSTHPATKKVQSTKLVDILDLESGESIPVPRFEKSITSNSQLRSTTQNIRTFDSIMDDTPAFPPPYEKLAENPKFVLAGPLASQALKNSHKEDRPSLAPVFQPNWALALVTSEGPRLSQNYQPEYPADNEATDSIISFSASPTEIPHKNVIHIIPITEKIWTDQKESSTFPDSSFRPIFNIISPKNQTNPEVSGVPTSPNNIYKEVSETFPSGQKVLDDSLTRASDSSSSEQKPLVSNLSEKWDNTLSGWKASNFNLGGQPAFDASLSEQIASSAKLSGQKVSDIYPVSPVSGLNLPAVATKLITDISASQATRLTTTSEPTNRSEQPIIDLSNLSIWKKLEKSIPNFINIEQEEVKVKLANEDNAIEEDKGIEEDEEIDKDDIFLVYSEKLTDPQDVQNISSFQRVQENIDFFSKEEKLRYSAVDPEEQQINTPKFSIVEENEERQPIFFEIPIQNVERYKEKEPPAEIRTIFVSPENAYNIPKRYKINLGSSYKYKAGDFNQIPPLESSSEKSSYDSPISSYDAPIAPSRQEDSFGDFFIGEDSRDILDSPTGKKFLRRIKITKKKKSFRDLKLARKDYKTTEPVRKVYSGLKARIPFGTRLGPKTPYTPLTL